MGPKNNKTQLSQASYSSPNKRLRKDKQINYLNACLQDSGLLLKSPPEKHIALHVTIQMIRNIKKNLESNFEYPRNVGELYDDLQKACQDMDVFKHYLFPNIVINTGDNSEDYSINDSVIKILINIPILQTKLLDFIFEKATDLAVQSNLEPWIQMILRCFSSLDHIVDSEKMSSNLINLLDITTEKMVRLKIITAIPDIIGDQHHNNIAMELNRLLSEDHDLIPAILDCLIYLCLSNEEHDHLQKQTLNILKSLSKCTYFPNFVKFLLMPSRLTENTCLAAVEGLRMALGWSTSTMNVQDIASSQVLTAAAIRNTIISSKMVANTWLKVIFQCKSSIDYKSIDIIVLLILFSTSEERQKQVENIIKKQVKLDILRNELIDEVFSKYKPILKEYLTNLLDLAKVFLKANGEVTIQLFASHFYMLMFKELEDCCPTIVAELLQYSLNSKQCISSILTILNYVFERNMSLLKHQSLQIISLLDRMDGMDLAEIRGIMNLLCGLAYGLENSFIKDDMHMIIRKELSSSNPKIKVQGILAGVHAVKYLMITQTLENLENEQSEKIYDAICHLPEGNLKDAAQIIELISQSIKHFSDMIAFFYDELSKAVSNSSNINKQFLAWLINAATNDWIQSFIVDSIDTETVNGIQLSMQYGLNDVNETIAINIAGLTLQNNAEISMNILSPLFQLVQTLHFKQNNSDLSSIDALLGCPIIMPQYDIDTIEELDQGTVSSILNCLVYSVNWFRELVNAFSTQNNESLKAKTLRRVQHIEELQLNIIEVLSKTKNLSYKSPTGLSNINNSSRLMSRNTAKSTKQPVNLQQSYPDVLIVETMRSQATQAPTTVRNRLDMLNNISFRQFNINLLSLLKSGTVGKEFNIKLINFILKSGNEILHGIMISKIKKHTFLTKQENTTYDSKKALEYAERVYEILPTIVAHLKIIITNLKNQLSGIQSDDDEVIMFSSEVINYITGLEQIYTMLTVYLKWIGFKDNHNIMLFKNSLKTIANSNDDKHSLKDLLHLIANELKNHEKYCLQLSTAISLMELLNAIQNYSDSKNILLIVKSMAHNFLSQPWKKIDGSPEKGLVFNQNIDFLASIYFINDEVLDLKTMLLELAHDITLLKSKTDTLGNLKSINKTNFPIIFRNIGTAVFEATKKRVNKGMTNSEHLELWRDIAHILKSMTEIVKTHKSNNSLSALFIKSMPILKLFTAQGIPVLKLEFKRHTDEVLQILKILQQSTRFLHSLCCHSRLKKNKALLSKVPYVKQILETLIYQVKAALAANNCSEAFWMGNLKNKDIHGDVIASQESIEEDSTEDGDVQLSDDEDCEDIDDELLNPESKSLSDII